MKGYITTILCASSCVGNALELDISQAISDAEAQKLTIPEESEYRVPTLNQYGYMFTKFDPIVERFLHLIESNPEQPFFEVGGAYGNVAEAALEKGAKNYGLNDCEERHLKSFAKKLQDQGKTELFQALHLISGRCPEDVKIGPNSLEAMLVNKVLHFFSPETIDTFVQWIYEGLKPNGRVFVMTISPFYKGHQDLLAAYQTKKETGIRFPGYCSQFRESKAAQKYEEETRPASLLFMELDTLKQLFIQHGFQIEEEFELAIIDQDNHEWMPGQDMVGIIAQKI
ncbi:MAG: class I SAM-dependent methyltransferase [Verrucomicrobia bacterium]|nr:class I SAM-dependent methyltransferase [Verrucomicrobiota bacterium]